MDDPTPQATPADLHPVRPVELDLPTLGRLVTAEAKALTEQADHVHDEITVLTDDIEADGTILAPAGAAGVVSIDELVAQLNGIGSTAYRIARHAFERVGGEIVDATLGGKCQVFRKANLHAALREL